MNKTNIDRIRHHLPPEILQFESSMLHGKKGFHAVELDSALLGDIECGNSLWEHCYKAPFGTINEDMVA